MSLPKLYLESTIPSYLTARRSRDLRLAANQEATQEWWECQRNEYELYVSAAVLAEAGEGDPVFAAEYCGARAEIDADDKKLTTQPTATC